MSIMKDAAELLESEDLIHAGFIVHQGHQAGTPHQTITIFPAGGPPGEGKHPSLKRTNLQFRVRADPGDYSTLEDAMTLLSKLHTIRGLTLSSGRRLVHVVSQGEPMGMGRDSQNRPEKAQTFTFVTEE